MTCAWSGQTSSSVKLWSTELIRNFTTTFCRCSNSKGCKSELLDTNKKLDAIKRGAGNSFGDADTANDGAKNALEVSRRYGPATDVVFNVATGRLKLVRSTS